MQEQRSGVTSIEETRPRFRGPVIDATDARYDETRRVWNGNIDRRPFAIVRCSGVADVIEAVNLARTNGLLLSVRGGGHNVAGHATCDGGIVIDLSSMKSVRIDPTARIAHVEGGATWADVDREAQVFGLATTGGMISNTGVGGLTLGGGLGWLMGKCGLSCDNVVSADVVTADGRCLRASATENAALFWGIRGEGGNFGIVTAFDFRLHQVGPMVLGGMVIHPLAHAKDVLRFYREFTTDLPDEAEAYAALLTSPDGIPIVALMLAYNGPIDKGERILAPARAHGAPVADLVGPMPYTVRQTLLDAAFAAHGLQRYWKSGFAEALGDELLDAAVGGAMQFSSPMSAMFFLHVHGAAARVRPDATAFALRRTQWDVNVVAQWTDSAESDRHIAWTRAVWNRMEPQTGGNAYINHIAADDRPERIRGSYAANYDRLVALKNAYDPTNLFRLNPNIRPTT